MNYDKSIGSALTITCDLPKYVNNYEIINLNLKLFMEESPS